VIQKQGKSKIEDTEKRGVQGVPKYAKGASCAQLASARVDRQGPNAPDDYRRCPAARDDEHRQARWKRQLQRRQMQLLPETRRHAEQHEADQCADRSDPEYPLVARLV
jgi:hypothetical protein